MPPRGVKSAKRKRQYEHIEESARKRGRSGGTAKRIAAATVNKQRRQSGEAGSGRSPSKTSKRSRKASARRSATKSAAKKSAKKR